jgi:hypothetical protein
MHSYVSLIYEDYEIFTLNTPLSWKCERSEESNAVVGELEGWTPLMPETVIGHGPESASGPKFCYRTMFTSPPWDIMNQMN